MAPPHSAKITSQIRDEIILTRSFLIVDYGQSVINFYILLIGYAFKCYIGELEVTKETTQEEKKMKPKLGDCENIYHNLCFSVAHNVQTDNTSTLAGSWAKYCTEKGPGLTTFLGEGVTDGCVEHPAKVSNIEACILP